MSKHQKLVAKWKLLPILSLLLLALFIAACGADTPTLDVPAADPDTEEAADTGGTAGSEQAADTPAAGTSGGSAAAPGDLSAKEAPILAEKVAAGELPPLEERLPATPYVVTPLEQPGEYGGIWDAAVTGQADMNGFISYSHEPWVMFDETCTEWSPNLAEAVEVSEDGRQFTFTIREGHKWSDGEPFTTEDVVFWYEAVATHPEVSAVAPSGILRMGDEIATLEAVDDRTFVVTFPKPAGLFLANIAFVFGGGDFGKTPAHYLSQFHADYADPDELEALVEEANLESWVELFTTKAGIAQGTSVVASNPDLPTIRAWKLTQVGPPWILERNPYYYKVDTEGRQLPYIDQIRAQAVTDASMISLSAVAGELSNQGRGINLSDLPLYLQNQEQGNYRVLKAPAEHPTGLAIFPNQNYQGDDEFLKSLIEDIRFRRALNLAIDRDEINELVYLGESQPIETVFPRQADQPELLDHLRYDPEAAKALLDEIGLATDSDGYRLRPDGSPLILPIEVFAGQTYMDATELVASYFDAIGIQTSLEEISYDLWWPRIFSFEYAFVAYVKDSFGGLTRYNYLRSYAPISNSSYWGPAWGTWYSTNGAEGVEPPADHPARIAQQLYDEALVTVDPARQLELLAEIERLNLENVWEVLTVGPAATIRIVKNNFHNVPAENYCQLYDSDQWAEQYYISSN
jgi:peptide/nickel transport system substrate-binding protein